MGQTPSSITRVISSSHILRRSFALALYVDLFTHNSRAKWDAIGLSNLPGGYASVENSVGDTHALSIR